MKTVLFLVILCILAVSCATPKRQKPPLPPHKVERAMSPRQKAMIIRYALPVPPQIPPPPSTDKFIVLSFPPSVGTTWNVYKQNTLKSGGWMLYDQPTTNVVMYLISPTNLSSFYTVTATQQSIRSVTLAWDPSPGPGIAGYKVYQGIASRNYTNSLSAGAATTIVISNLVANNTYYFAATAYDTNGIESDYSSEVSQVVSKPSSFPVRTSIKTSPDPPVVSALAATNVTATTAVVQGVVNSTGGAALVKMFFYGTNLPTKTNPWQSIAVTGTNTASYQSITLSNLISGVTYYYNFAAENAAGLCWSSNSTFTTASAPLMLKAKPQKEQPIFSPLPEIPPRTSSPSTNTPPANLRIT